MVDGKVKGVVSLEGERTFLFGRAAHCHGRLDDPTVSGDHLAITRHGDVLMAKDLGSSNGTLLNGGKLEKETRIRDRDVLVLGNTRLQISLSQPIVATLRQRDTGPIELSPTELEIIRALVAPFRVPGALAARPASRAQISELTEIPERTVTRRLAELAFRLKLPASRGSDRAVLIAQKALELGLDGQRPLQEVERTGRPLEATRPPDG